jgi:acyl-ACP thioesterase
MPIFERCFSVTGRDVDPSDRVRADAIALMLQESGAHHADRWGLSVPALQAEGRTWVLARLAVAFEGPRPGWKTELKVETWSRGFRGHVATRDSLVRIASGPGQGDIVARASSVWFIIDLGTRRPVRLSDYAGKDEAEAGLASGIEASGRLEPPQGQALEVSLPVRASDLDLNGHVNNVRYVEWLYESVPPRILEGSRLSRMEIHYTGETRYPGLVRLRSWPLAGGEAEAPAEATFIHSFNREDGAEVIRARTSWVETG